MTAFTPSAFYAELPLLSDSMEQILAILECQPGTHFTSCDLGDVVSCQYEDETGDTIIGLWLRRFGDYVRIEITLYDPEYTALLHIILTDFAFGIQGQNIRRILPILAAWRAESSVA